MTTLHQWQMPAAARRGNNDPIRLPVGRDRRQHRRHDMEPQGITVERWDVSRGSRTPLGQIVDLSASGVKIRTMLGEAIHPDQQIRVRLELPTFAGICPFVDTTGPSPQPRRDWVGWLTVSRVTRVGGHVYDIAGRLVDMEDMDRGMLGLYLSTQPLAA